VVPVGEYFQNLTVVHKSKSGKIEQEAIMSVVALFVKELFELINVLVIWEITVSGRTIS